VLRVDMSGTDLLPTSGAFVISPNHQSYFDVFLLVAALPYRVFRTLFFVGASEYFQTRLTRWLARQLNVIPVDPDASLVPAMQAGAFGLRHHKVLVLFPEGERSIDGTVRTFKKGAAILAEHLDVPIVPVAIDGAYELWPRNRPINWRVLRPWRRPRVMIAFGDPIRPAAEPALAGVAAAAPAAAYTAMTARLKSAVEGMWTEIHAARTQE
jgi:long-chain acyl-CoA synthetase